MNDVVCRRENGFSTLPAYAFRGMGSVNQMYLYDNELELIEENAFNGVRTSGRVIITKHARNLTVMPGVCCGDDGGCVWDVCFGDHRRVCMVCGQGRLRTVRRMAASM